MSITKKLSSGNEYNLSELFSENRKIIIPDLQRDYCWGNKAHGPNKDELVTGFINSLFDIFSKQKDIDTAAAFQLGMIYGYEEPDGFIHLCDCLLYTSPSPRDS